MYNYFLGPVSNCSGSNLVTARYQGDLDGLYNRILLLHLHLCLAFVSWQHTGKHWCFHSSGSYENLSLACSGHLSPMQMLVAHIHAVLCSNLQLASQGRPRYHLLFPWDKIPELLVQEKLTVNILHRHQRIELLMHIPTKEEQLCPTHLIGYANLPHGHTEKTKTTEFIIFRSSKIKKYSRMLLWKSKK